MKTKKKPRKNRTLLQMRGHLQWADGALCGVMPHVDKATTNYYSTIAQYNKLVDCISFSRCLIADIKTILEQEYRNTQ